MIFPTRSGGFNSRRDNGSDRRGGFGGRGRSDEPRELHDATCSKCGSACKVPFEPSSRREVFCSKCFENVSGGESRERPSRFGNRSYSDNRGSRDSYSSRGSEDRRLYDATCSECGKSCQIPFEPRNGKPVFCSSCFEHKSKTEGNAAFSTRPSNSIALEAINVKLDKILKLLGATEAKPVEVKNIAKKETKQVVTASEVVADEVVAETAPTEKKKAKTAKKKIVSEE